ncbi:hypothetical protein Enr10x_07710 [Gimesia panareensis]|uniref:Uncharacterized protein n=1 Tax=Gimesia panareensis TaxID=2527978 RepID=A0A517Q1H4_9PLAN|nr:hypothetical protein [Gimesia panareensis]QDT25475.1 hypothetical protein Enr10x_07710 [Gimesia panareensis]
MKLNLLTQTVSTPRMHPIDNLDYEYRFRIEIWKQQGTSQYFATVERSFYCDVHVLSANMTATEMIRSVEEQVETEEEFFDSEQRALDNALTKLSHFYEPF